MGWFVAVSAELGFMGRSRGSLGETRPDSRTMPSSGDRAESAKQIETSSFLIADP
jgi:hypothetical protein